MRKMIWFLSPRAAICAMAAISAAPVTLTAATPPGRDEAIEAQFDAAIDPAEMDGWLKMLAAAPNHVGAPHNKENAEWVLRKFRDWGWDAKIETFKVLYPTPLKVGLDLLGARPYSATLTEPPVPGDAPTNAKDALPAYLAYQGDGDVTAPLVYVNYGMPDDYEALKRMGVSVKGKIVIARYGAGWRGLKPKLAQEHGAVGCIIYSDPQNDGYATEDVYPKGPARPPQGFQRGSVEDMTTHPGDPLTPGIGATEKAKRLRRADSKVILHIPAIPISYSDAQHFLAAMGGQVAPRAFRGALGITYHIGDDNAAKAHLVVKSDWSDKTLYNVVARMKGSTYPDQWVLRGNHRDGWVMGATDPLSGQVAMLAEAKAIGALAQSGWRPKRTLVYLSWDGEEPGLLGSTEWAETHAVELQRKAMVYINSDTNARGFLYAQGSHSLQHFVNDVAKDVVDPETKLSVAQRLRGKLVADSLEKGASPTDMALGEIAMDTAKDLPIGPLGSGSDYSAFLQHLGLAALNIGYGGEGRSGGVYHSLYDDYQHYSAFVDPGSLYAGVLSKTIGRMALRAANAELPPMRYADFSQTIAQYLDEIEKLADAKRQAAAAQAAALKANAFMLAADPQKPSAAPTELKPVPHFNFAPLENAVDRLKDSAQAYDGALSDKGESLSSADKSKLFDMARMAEQALSLEAGLPGRPWYKNLITAPGALTGYGAKTLPAVREAIEQERFEEVDAYAALTAAALNAYADQLDRGTALLNGDQPPLPVTK